MTGEGAVPRQKDYVSPIGNVVSLHPALRVRFIHLALPPLVCIPHLVAEWRRCIGG